MNSRSLLPTQIDKSRLRTLKMIFPLHKEGLTSYLSPILGQYAIKNSDFIQNFFDSFNKSTDDRLKARLSLENVENGSSFCDEEAFIPLTINIYKAGKFSIVVKPLQVGKLFSQGLKKKRRFLRYIDLSTKKSAYLFRNTKKLFQIAIFKVNPHLLLDDTNSLVSTSHLKPIYVSVRNSLFQSS